MNAGAMRVLKQGVGEASTGSRYFNKKTGNKPVAYWFTQLTITVGAAAP